MIEILKADKLITQVLAPQKPKPGIRYIPSQFVLPLEHKGKRYVFNVLTKQCVEGSLPEQAFADGGYNPLIQGMFLVPDTKDECSFYSSTSAILRMLTLKEGVREFTVTVTLGCNARCVYCYEEGLHPVAMTPEVADQTIRYILKNRRGNKVILSWFGGEPLLGAQIIDRICAGVRDAGVAFESHMITNGSLVTPDIVDKMVHEWNLNRIQISMDGAEPDYVMRKRYYADHDQYHAVLRGIDLMMEKGIQVKVRCNVDEDNIDRIPDFIRDIRQNITHWSDISLNLAPLFAVRTGENDLLFWKKLLKIREAYESMGIRITGMNGFSRTFRINNCLADGNGVVIHPDGGLYPCEHFPSKNRFGDVWNGTTDEAARMSFCRTDLIREKCRKCLFLPDCTGFASCPIQEYHCREMRELLAIETLRRIIDKHAEEEEPENDPLC